ncbi:ATP-binding protein [Streptomyces sp. NPDC086091]|uniref:ATP-binding protein n=1 Tax=Streptomyces sp. NPDC086091 TaxID=3365751 RepID=UPI00380CDE4A
MIAEPLVGAERQQLVIGVSAGLSVLADVRRSVRSWLTMTDAAPCADEACLVTHELLANAMEHGSAGEGSRVEVRLDVVSRAGLLRITVRDEGGIFPTEPSGGTSATEEAGRGLSIVSALSRAWGMRAGNSGKSVWATLGI